MNNTELREMLELPEAELFVRTDHLGGYATDDGGCLLWSFGRRSESDAALYTADQVRQFAAAQNAELQARIVELEAAVRRYQWLHGKAGVSPWGSVTDAQIDAAIAKDRNHE